MYECPQQQHHRPSRKCHVCGETMKSEPRPERERPFVETCEHRRPVTTGGQCGSGRGRVCIDCGQNP